MTPEDVIFTLRAAARQGPAALQALTTSKIAKMEKVGERGVRFTFNDKADRELPLILGAAADPAQARDRRGNLRQVDAEADDRQRPLRLDSGASPARSSCFKRNPDYWAKDIPSKRGFDNYDAITLNYFRDENAMFEAFKKGAGRRLTSREQRPLGEPVRFPGRDATGDIVKETLQDAAAVRHVRLRA